ncbi:hypothetical protein ACJX0J_011226, partial [Zea mays]
SISEMKIYRDEMHAGYIAGAFGLQRQGPLAQTQAQAQGGAKRASKQWADVMQQLAAAAAAVGSGIWFR